MSDATWNPSENSLESDPDVSENVTSSGSSNPQPVLHHWWRWAILAIGLLAVGALIFAVVAWRQAHAKVTPANNVTITTQSLDNGTLTKLEKQSAGSSTQQLVVNPDTVYKNNVAVNQGLQVNGPSNLQGATSIAGNLAVRGSISVTGQISAGSLNVGALNVSSVNATGNLAFAGHLLPGGPKPSGRTGNANGGGSVSVDGTDVSGTISFTTGNSPNPGQLVSINFARAYGNTPKIVLTPVTGDGANLRYYVTRSAGFFTVEAANTPQARTTYVFDYHVTE